MTDQEFSRILTAVSGYWPHAELSEPARKAWRHLLCSLSVDAVLEALAGYAIESHPFPPVAGQLRARVSPPTETGTRETEVDRCRRQRADAVRRLRDGRMKRADFDFYESEYWSKHIDPHASHPAA